MEINRSMNNLYYCTGLAKLFILALAVTIHGCASENGASADISCLEASADTYPVQSSSRYVLPFPIGETHFIGQGNCTNVSHNDEINQQFAYDIQMPIGNSIVAVRGGVVVAIEEGFVDGTGKPREENYIVIEHIDNTVSRYIHLTTLGALVDLQETVVQGQVIAISGNTGNSSEPHLHFDVGDGPCTPHVQTSCRSLPVNFRNTSAHQNGLIQGQSYTAL